MRANEGEVQAPRPSLQLQLLGRFRLAHPGGETASPGRKARAILAFLVLAPGYSATREQLAGLLWSDRGPDQARASLRQSLKELRELACIGSAITTARDAVSLDRTAVAVDLHEIRHAASARDLVALAGRLEQVRGDLLEDFLDLSPAFDEWLQAERARQHDLVLGDSLDALEADGLADMKNTRSILRSLDRLDPVNEAVVRLGMQLDHAAGDGASLHRRYRQLCDRLESEFAALPSEETRALFHALATNRDAAPRPRSPPVEIDPEPASPGIDMVPLIMVAPLQVAAADEQLAALAELCADDIRVSLSRMRGIQALALEDAALPDIVSRGDDALGIYLLSGSLRRLGGEIRANVQLADAATRIILWSDSLRSGESAEALVDAVVGKAAGAVLPAIDRDLNRRLREPSGDVATERALYTHARVLIRNGRELPAVEKGVRLLEKLVEHNPQHFGARLLLARIYNSDFWHQLAGHDVRQFRDTAERHLQAAAAIEPGHYSVRIAQAWRLLRRGQIAAAQREFEALLAGLPHDAEVANMCAVGFCFIGQFDKAEQLMQRAFFLNPFPPSDYHADYAVVLALKRECEAAEEHFAVSGETGLMYGAARLANAAHLDGGAARLSAVADDFVDGFRHVWQPATEPTLADILEWACYNLPLHPAEHRDWLTQGLQQMLEPRWPATGGGGS